MGPRNLFQRIWRWAFGQRRNVVRQPIRKLQVERLEDIIAPAADYFWKPPGNDVSMSTLGNWADQDGNYTFTELPGQHDRLIFNSNSGKNCDAPANLANTEYAAIKIDNYRTQLQEHRLNLYTTLTFSGDERNQKSEFSQGIVKGYNLPVQGNGPADLASIVFNGSPVDVGFFATFESVKFDNRASNNVTVIGLGRWINSSGIINAGTITVNNEKEAFLGNSYIVNNAGTIVLADTGSITRDAADTDSILYNYGILRKTGDAETTARMAAKLDNRGYMQIQGGALNLTGTSYIQATRVNQQYYPIITVNTDCKLGWADNVLFVVADGFITGTGTLHGTLTTRVPGNLGIAEREVVIHPGDGVVPGILTIEGNLMMRTDSIIEIVSTAPRTFAKLVIRRANNADANGLVGWFSPKGAQIKVIRDNGVSPGLLEDFTLVEYQRFHDTAPYNEMRFVFPANRWTINNVQNLHFSGRNAFGRATNDSPNRVFIRVVIPGFAGGRAANAVPGNPALLTGLENDPIFTGTIFLSKVNGNSNDVGVEIATSYGGSFMALDDGSFDYVPPENFSGVDHVQYTVSDGSHSEDYDLYIYVDESTTAIVENPTFTSNHDDELDIATGDYSKALLDHAFNFDPENVAIIEVNGDDEAVGVEVATTQGGAVAVNADGSFHYTAPANYIGDDTFTVTVGDGVDSAEMTVTIHLVNTFAVDGDFSTLRDTDLILDDEHGLLNLAGDVDGDPIEVVKVNGSTENVGEEINTTLGGTVTVNADGSLNYSPPASTEGDDTFEVTIGDGDSESTFTVTIHVVKVLAIDAGFEGAHQYNLEVGANEGLLTFAQDADDDPLEVIAINGSTDAIGEETPTAMGGTITVESDGSFTYTPPANFSGLDWASYTVSDGTNTSTALFMISVTNTAPLNNADEEWTLENNHLSVEAEYGLLVGATDMDGDSLSIAMVNDEPLVDGSVTVTGEHGGTLTVYADGSFEYDPAEDFTGDEVFWFAITDGIDFDWASLTIHVTPET